MKRDLGDRDGALAALEESLAIRRALPQTDLTKWQIDVAENLETIGDLKLAAGDKEGALKLYEEMLGLDRTMVANDAANAQWKRNMSISLNRVGDGKLALGDAAAAQALYEEGLVVRRGLAEAEKTVQRQQDVALNLEKIGDLKRSAGDFAGALKGLRGDAEHCARHRDDGCGQGSVEAEPRHLFEQGGRRARRHQRL